MLIYFNGDSNTEGTELDNPSEQGFAGKLAKKFNAQHINQAFAGASNDKIFRTTEEYLQECKTKNQFPDLIIIGWTEWIREDWFINGEYHSLNSFGLRNPETVDQARFKQWEEYQRMVGEIRLARIVASNVFASGTEKQQCNAYR